MFTMYMVSTSRREKLTVEILYGSQVLCQVYEDEAVGGYRVDFSCDKFVGVPEVAMDFSIEEFNGAIDEAVAALRN